MMPFIEIMFCGLAPSILPFPGTGEDAEGPAGGHSAPLQGHQHSSLLSPPLHAQPLPPPGFLGTPCPPLAVAEGSGYPLVQSCIIKLPWLFASETFTIPCSAGKDDCSKPKLGINYTTTLHFFFYKGKLCGKSCAGSSFPTSCLARIIVEGCLNK